MIPSFRLPAALLTALAAAAALSGSPRATAAEPDATPAASPAATAAVVVTPAPAVSPAATVVPAPTPVPTPVVTAAQHAAAEELVTAMHTQAVVENANKQMLQSIDQIAEGMTKSPVITPELTADVQKMREDSTTLVTQKLGWDIMKEDIVRPYAENFTEAELKEITAFYRTPAGEKLIEKQPKLAENLSRIMRQRSMSVVPVIRQKIQTLTIKLRPPAPVRPLGSPGVAPGAPVPPAVPMVPAPPAPAPTAAATPPVTSAPVPAPTAAVSPTP